MHCINIRYASLNLRKMDATKQQNYNEYITANSGLLLRLLRLLATVFLIDQHLARLQALCACMATILLKYEEFATRLEYGELWLTVVCYIIFDVA